MFSLMFINNIEIEKPILTKYHYEIVSIETDKNKKEEKYDFWSDKELQYISKVDLSTPLEDDEDYSKW